MEYTIQEIAQQTGVSKRTLRYYDEIGLVQPAKRNTAGYRIYTKKEKDVLQEILYYRSLNLSLKKISQLMKHSDYQFLSLLEEHHRTLLHKRKELDKNLSLLITKINHHKTEIVLMDPVQFTKFMQEKWQDWEDKYGKESREKYSGIEIANFQDNYQRLSPDDFKAMEEAEGRVFSLLQKSFKCPSTNAQMLFESHKRWLTYYLSSYSSVLHRNLADLYVTDLRFTTYYDERTQVGATQYLREVIFFYTLETR